MNKILLSFFLIPFCVPVFSDASVDSQKSDKSFLLNAPGTLSGVIKRKSSDEVPTQTFPPVRDSIAGGTLAVPQQLETGQNPAAAQTRQYRYVQENDRKFRQFGQTNGQSNPWYDEQNSPYARQPESMRSHPITNPWQLGGMPPLTGMTESRPDYSQSPYSSSAPNMYSRGYQLYPDYPDGIYRDSNPALLGVPGQSGFLPGFDGNNFPFPISPFGMF